MKKVYLALMWSLLIIPLSAQISKPLDLDKSQVTWEGLNLFSLGGHFGTVKFKSGELLFKNEVLVGGKFVADMNTIANTDGGFSQGLVDHLKDPDFFGVVQFPTAELKLTKVQVKPNDTFLLDVDFTIKGITHSFAIYKVDKVDEGVYRAIFKIDRTKWDIRYGSRSFFDDLGDNVISDAIKLDVLIWLKEDK